MRNHWVRKRKQDVLQARPHMLTPPLKMHACVWAFRRSQACGSSSRRHPFGDPALWSCPHPTSHSSASDLQPPPAATRTRGGHRCG